MFVLKSKYQGKVDELAECKMDIEDYKRQIEELTNENKRLSMIEETYNTIQKENAQLWETSKSSNSEMIRIRAASEKLQDALTKATENLRRIGIKCSCCGEYYLKEDVKSNGEELVCENCYKATQLSAQEVVEVIVDEPQNTNEIQEKNPVEKKTKKTAKRGKKTNEA